MIPAGDQWGPFAPGLDHAERLARLRSLRALARVYAGPRAADVCRLLAQAEREPAALEPASVAINRLAATDRRNVLASYLRLSFPTQELSIMNDPQTTGHLTDAALSFGQSLLALVVVVEGKPSAGPAVKAYQTAIRRKGEEAAASGGIEAMQEALRVVIDADPDRAQQRERIVRKAWADLPSWQT